MSNTIYDVLQVGYGPVSEALAIMLGAQGRSVAIVERWRERYPLPRAVCIDHELYRVLSANGLGDVLPSISHPAPLYQWFNAEWKELLAIDWPAESVSGGPEVHFVHQPTIEETLDRAVRDRPSVDVLLGREAIRIEQHADYASVVTRDTKTGEEHVLKARYVVGCDGANSMVREAIGGAREDLGFEADWLVIDVLLKEGVTIETLGIPAAGQYCNPERPTTIVPAGVREGRTFRRWEFFRMPGERSEDLEAIDKVWSLLSPWAGPDDVEIVRHKIYNFRSLLAERWRNGRVLIAGDAAHVMPPFMGQGMCSGLRDAWNLAWKLALVLDGRAEDRLLDTYQAERRPHVRQIIDISIYLGKIICIPDAGEAAERDRMFLAGEAPPPPPFPQLTDGLLHRPPAGDFDKVAGLLSPHGRVRSDFGAGRFDDVLGLGFLLIGWRCDPTAELDHDSLAFLDAMPIRVVQIYDEPVGGERVVVDVDGKFVAFMKSHGIVAMIVRPDFYIYGGADTVEDIGRLIGDLRHDLERAGVDLTGAPRTLAATTVN